jgi:hypothetical protein
VKKDNLLIEKLVGLSNQKPELFTNKNLKKDKPVVHKDKKTGQNMFLVKP